MRNKLLFRMVKRIVKIIINPLVSFYRRYIYRKKAILAQKHYVQVIKNIRESGRTNLNFAAYVMYDTDYSINTVFEMMIADKERWNPKIVVVPDVMRGKDHAIKLYNKTREYLIKCYGKEYVLDGWDSEKDEYYDYINEFDIIYYNNPYDSMAHEYHKIEYTIGKNVLPIHVSYGYDIGYYTTLSRVQSLELNIIWKCFTDTTFSYEFFKQHQLIGGKNVVLSGYAKMDDLAKYQVEAKKRKKILISPHHTVSMKLLPLSNFIDYSELYLKLPDMFPQVDFVFRPHPLLFTTLVNNNIWSQEKVESYLNKLTEKGVIYSTEGNYFDVFSDCDAIINDCGSFTIEWLFTGKPGCFVLNRNLTSKFITPLMEQAIEKYDIAKNADDIVEFVTRISRDMESPEYKMDKWVLDNIAINYPDVSTFILNEINILNYNN